MLRPSEKKRLLSEVAKIWMCNISEWKSPPFSCCAKLVKTFADKNDPSVPVSGQRAAQRLQCDHRQSVRRGREGDPDHWAGDHAHSLLFGLLRPNQGRQRREQLPSSEPRHTVATWQARWVLIFIGHNESFKGICPLIYRLRDNFIYFFFFFFVFPGLRAGKLNVTVQNDTSFTIRWGADLIQNYVCYSAEWRTTGNKTVHESFFEDRNNYKNLAGSQIFHWQL